MNDPEFQKAYEEQNRRDYVANADDGTVVSIPLNLFCSIIDYFMYPDMMSDLFLARGCSVW